MKKSRVFFIAMLVLSLTAKAQIPKKGNFGGTIGIQGIAGALTTKNSTTNSLMLKYYLKDGLAIRAAINYVPKNTEFVRDTNSNVPNGFGVPNGNGFSMYTEKSKESGFFAEIGIQKSIRPTDKLEPYIAGIISYNLGGERVISKRTDWLKDEPGVRLDDDYDEIIFHQKMSNNIGFNLLVGVNYFIVDKISIGAELGYGYYTSSSEGGNVEENHKIGSTITNAKYKLNNYKDKRSGAQTTGAVITISFFI
ncbi:MAG: hypothetical protein WCK02_15560 [Bacteroidota bacterium]